METNYKVIAGKLITLFPIQHVAFSHTFAHTIPQCGENTFFSLSPASNLMSSDSLPLTEEPKKTMSLR